MSQISSNNRVVAGVMLKGEDIFCSEGIMNGTFYMTKHTRAVCDIAPVVPGHSLIIPIRHVADILELSEEEKADMLYAMAKVTPILLRLYGDESGSYDMTAQIGRYSGMSIRHLHFHIIPRRRDDPYQGSATSVYDAIEKRSNMLGTEEYARRVEMLRKEMRWSK